MVERNGRKHQPTISHEMRNHYHSKPYSMSSILLWGESEKHHTWRDEANAEKLVDLKDIHVYIFEQTKSEKYQTRKIRRSLLQGDVVGMSMRDLSQANKTHPFMAWPDHRDPFNKSIGMSIAILSIFNDPIHRQVNIPM